MAAATVVDIKRRIGEIEDKFLQARGADRLRLVNEYMRLKEELETAEGR
jgi:hypothetical protein